MRRLTEAELKKDNEKKADKAAEAAKSEQRDWKTSEESDANPNAVFEVIVSPSLQSHFLICTLCFLILVSLCTGFY